MYAWIILILSILAYKSFNAFLFKKFIEKNKEYKELVRKFLKIENSKVKTIEEQKKYIDMQEQISGSNPVDDFVYNFLFVIIFIALYYNWISNMDIGLQFLMSFILVVINSFLYNRFLDKSMLNTMMLLRKVFNGFMFVVNYLMIANAGLYLGSHRIQGLEFLYILVAYILASNYIRKRYLKYKLSKLDKE
jgi:membrane protein implicated in regulation of membrane protease activity